MSTEGWIEYSGGRVPLILSTLPKWTLTEGIQPSEGSFDLVPTHAEILKASFRTPVTLVMTAQGVTQKIKNLWVEGVTPSPNQFISRVKLADRRRFLKYGIIISRYNIRRNIGVHRVNSNFEPLLNDVVPTAWFAAYSLKNPLSAAPNDTDRWTARDLLKDVFKKAQRPETRHTGKPPPEVQITPDIRDLERTLQIDSLTIDDRADFAISRALSSIPEAAFTIDTEGNFVVFSRVNGAEAKYVKLLGPEMANRGHISSITNEQARPKGCEVFFTIESEVRLDAVEGSTETGGTQTALPTPVDQRILQNVAPVPDFEITIAGLIKAQGSIETLDALLGAWGVPPDSNISGSQITHNLIQKMLVAYIDLYGPFGLTGLRSPNQDWAARAGCIQSNYRRTYMIPPRWNDRFLSWAANRVGIVDPVSGRRAPSEVYMDYHKIPSQKGFYKSRSAGVKRPIAINVAGYPQGAARSLAGGYSVNDFDKKTKAAPFGIAVLDEDQGVLQFVEKPDQYRLWEHVAPSKVVFSDGSEGGGPSSQYSDALNGVPVCFDLVFDPNRIPKLAAAHKAAVIISAIPACPNDERQLYKVKVAPADVKAMIPASARKGLDAAYGPIMQIRIGGSLEGARALIRWDDARSADIEKLFGVQDGEPNLQGLVLNSNQTSSAGGISSASLDEIAKAVVARLYARFADHLEGEATSMVNPKLSMDGWISDISIEIDNEGVLTSRIALPEQLPELPFKSLLDQSTRAILFREIPGK